MKMGPKVSVILPTYNRAPFLPRAVKSILAQSFSDWELFVIDDGSTGETQRVIQPYLTDPRIHFLKKKREGVAAKTRNAGLRLARGKYVAFLDDDDLFLPHKLERQVTWMDERPAVGLLYSLIQVADADLKPLKIVPKNPGRSFLELFQENPIQVATVLVRRTCFDTVGFFDESLLGSEDYLMWLRIAERFPIDFLPETLAIYCKHGQNKSKFAIRQLQNRLRILDTFSASRTKGLTQAMKNRCLSITHYRLAREFRDTADYFQAAKHFLNAFRLNPAVGAAVKQPLARGPQEVLRALRPYGGLVYCIVKGYLHSRGGQI